jgi:hypothetical protein
MDKCLAFVLEKHITMYQLASVLHALHFFIVVIMIGGRRARRRWSAIAV